MSSPLNQKATDKVKKRKRKITDSRDNEKEIDQDSQNETQTQKLGKEKEKSKSGKSDDGRPSSPTHLEEQDDENTSQLLVEPISHKEKRKRKKLEKKMTMAQTDDNHEEELKQTLETNLKTKVVKSSKTVESIFTTTSRSNYSIWVGNLLFSTTAQELARFFQSCGKITRLNMPSGKREHENNKGFAYVDFETASGVDNAIEKSESPLGGRKLLIKRATDYSGRPSSSSIALTPSTNASSIYPTTLMKSARKILDLQKQPPAPCIYFGNLGFETTSESIISMLQAHHQAQLAWKPKAVQANLGMKLNSNNPSNENKEDDNSCTDSKKNLDIKDTSTSVGIRKVRMGTFEDSGKCKGFAFVDFESVAHATNALLNTKNHKLDGRSLQVEYASAEAVKRGGGSLKLIQHKRPSRNSGDAIDSDQLKSINHQKSTHKSTNFEAPRLQTGAPTVTHNRYFTAAPPLKTQPPFQLETSAVDQHTKPKKEYRGRQKPGAVLANARRAPTGIIKFPDQCGKKTVFT